MSYTPVTGTIGTLGVLQTGTLAQVGTVLGIGGTVVVSGASAGTNVNIVTGTQQTLGTLGVLNNLVTGTLANSGTTTGVGVVTTVTTLSNLTNGSLNILTGTLNNVTLNQKWVGSAILTTHTRGTAGGTTLGTLVAPVGAGTNIYVNGFSIVAVSGTPDCAIMTNVVGSTGANVFTRGVFAPGGGIARSFSNPILVGTNGTLAYMVLNGTADFATDYWVGP